MAMDHDQLVRKAAQGDAGAFVELTRRFQHFAFGSPRFSAPVAVPRRRSTRSSSIA